MIKSFVALALAGALLVGCAEKGKESTSEQIAASVYRPAGPPSITVITMVNNRTGAGAHSALLINASQSVLFDPAGSFEHERVPERGDVLYGMTPSWVRSYKSAHARETFHVVSQEIPLSAAQAERALQLVQANGAVPSAMCANATSGILRQVPGLQNIRQSFYPLKLMDQIEQMPNVTTTRLYENDSGNVRDGVAG